MHTEMGVRSKKLKVLSQRHTGKSQRVTLGQEMFGMQDAKTLKTRKTPHCGSSGAP